MVKGGGVRKERGEVWEERGKRLRGEREDVVRDERGEAGEVVRRMGK